MGEDEYTYEYYSSNTPPSEHKKQKSKPAPKKEKETVITQKHEKEMTAPKPIIKNTTVNPVYAKKMPELKPIAKKQEVIKKEKEKDEALPKKQEVTNQEKEVIPKLVPKNETKQIVQQSAPTQQPSAGAQQPTQTTHATPDFNKEFLIASKIAETESKNKLPPTDTSVAPATTDDCDDYSSYYTDDYSSYYSSDSETEQEADASRLLEFAKKIPTMKTDYNNLNFIYRSCIEANGSNEYTPAQIVFLDALIARMKELKPKK